MDHGELWRRYRYWLYDEPQSGFRLDVSRMELDEHFLHRMAQPLEQALARMDALERGEIANPDEQRMVGHYWLRAPELAPDPVIRREIEDTRDRVIGFSRRVREGIVRAPGAGRFTRLLLVGIGGSALGPQFLADALGNPGDTVRPYFLDNTDPDGIDRVLGQIGPALAETLTVVISKSGGTPETRNGMLEAAEAYRSRGLGFGQHAVAVTGVGSELDRTAEEAGFIERFPMWDWVGGRTSVLSAVGLLPAALLGFDIGGLLAGAAAMDRSTRSRELRRNPAALLALSWYHAGNGRGERDMVILPYKDRLALFSRYLQQLVMESLGKQLDLDGNVVHQGIAVYGNKGSTDQHAYVQQLRDGLANFFATFVEIQRDRDGQSLELENDITSGDYLAGFLHGTRQALYENGRRSITVTVERVDARTIGMLIALYERAVGLYASLINVNAYHQPGVEAGKQAAASVLELQRRLLARLRDRAGQAATCEVLAADCGVTEQAETVFKILEHLAANPGRGVSRLAGATPFDARYSYRECTEESRA